MSVRTPESRFKNLPNFPYTPNYVDLASNQGLRLAYIDEQTANYTRGQSNVFLCLHGVPTYSFLFRNVIPVLLNSNESHHNGVRVVCPDLIGFGRSDKPTQNNASVHSLHFHRQSMMELISHLRLTNVTLIVQDWGGLIGLTLPMSVNTPNNAIITRVILFNTFIPDGTHISQGFLNWRQYSTNEHKTVSAGRVIHSSARDTEKGDKYGGLTSAEKQAYDAPFVDESYKVALRVFPAMVAITPTDAGMDIWNETWTFWKRNKLLDTNERNKINIFIAHGCRDVVFEYNIVLKLFRALISDTFNPLLGSAMEIGGILFVPNAAHFTQESKSIQWIINKALKWFGDIPFESVEYEWVLSTNKKTKEYNARILKVLLNDKSGVHPLTPTIIQSLHNIFDFAESNDYCRGVILSAFTKHRLLLKKRPIFCAGLDLRIYQKNDATLSGQYTLSVRELWKRYNLFSKPLVSAVNGDAIAGGCLLALSADYRIGYKHTCLQMIEAQIGLPASAAVVAQIARVTPSKDIASYVLQTAIPFSNEKALKLNLLSSVVSDEEVNLRSGGPYDQNIMSACVNVLENEYFNGQYSGAASAKKGCRQSLIDIIEEEIKEIESKGDTKFLNKNVQKYINKTVKSKL